jgi:hypothetical protein
MIPTLHEGQTELFEKNGSSNKKLVHDIKWRAHWNKKIFFETFSIQ